MLVDDRQSGPEARPAARLYLTLWLGRTGRTAEAREHLDAMLGVPPSETVALFEGFVLGVQSWLDNLDGLYGTALGRAVRALDRSQESMAQMVAPQMTAIHLVTVAWALGGLGGERRAADAARLLALHDALLPGGYVPTAAERENLALAEELVRAALPDDEAYARAYAEGGGLTLEEATALMDAHVRESEAG